MGDTKKIRKKYSKPVHPWNRERIDEERRYSRTYGLQNKKELWKADSILKGFKDQIKSFPSMDPDQAAVQQDKLRKRLLKLGLIDAETSLGEVLGYSTEKILERRLQSIVYKQDMAKSAKQARQMIVHEHILVDGEKINAPGYLVSKHEEANITFDSSSPFFDEMHPERTEEEQRPDKQAPKSEQPEKDEIADQQEDTDNE